MYARVGEFGFVYDDSVYILDNPHVLGGPTGENLRWALTALYADNWHPLTWISHQLDILFFGLQPRGHHLVNLSFHAVNSGLLFLLLSRMTGALWRSAFPAALFAIHPLHVESVAWLSERKDLLSAFFMLLTVRAYLWYVAAPRRRRRLLVVAGGLAAGLMAKPMLVTLPFVLLLLDFWPLNRLMGARQPQQSPASSPRYPEILPLLIEKLPLLMLSALVSVVTYIAQQAGGAMVLMSGHPVSARLANAVVSYLRYLGKMVWPADLAAIYPHPAAGWPPALTAAAALTLAVVTALTLRHRRRRPYLATGWFWYLGMLVPVIGLVQVGFQAMADRYTYLPLIGVSICIAWSVPDLLSRVRLRREALIATAVLLLVSLAARTRSQLPFWRDDGTLFAHAREVTTGNFVAEYNLGNALMKQGNVLEATDHYREAVRIKPDYVSAHNNLGATLAVQGRNEEALFHYREALRLEPDFAEALVGFGSLLRTLERFGEAEQLYRRALQVRPRDAAAHFGLGASLAHQGRNEEATAQLCDALSINPDLPLAHVYLGNILSAAGKVEEGKRSFLEALRIEPDNTDALYNLGVALAIQGRFAEAAARFREALQIRPDFPEARADLEKVLALSRR